MSITEFFRHNLPDGVGCLCPSITMAPMQTEFDYEQRFAGVARLYGKAGLARFRAAHVCVIGVGGVGSWAVEALARSAIGELTLIDLDHVAESNINRQIQALGTTLGQVKIEALSRRIQEINPDCRVHRIDAFVKTDNLDALLGKRHFDYVIDAIDGVSAKAALIAYCRQHGLPLVTVGGAGGQTDPTRIQITDLNRTEQEPLLAKVRKLLRARHGFPRGTRNKFGIDAVFSSEPLRYPVNSQAAFADGQDSASQEEASLGTSMAVTASFGMAAASLVLRRLAGA